MVGDFLLIVFGVILFAVVDWPALVHRIQIVVSCSIRCDFAAGPEAVTGGEFSPETQQLIGQLQDLGFKPVGIKREWWPFRPKSRALTFASQEARAFADIDWLGPSPHMYFYTPFTDGAVVLTNDHDQMSMAKDGFVRTGIRDGAPAALLEYHGKRLREMAERGHLPLDRFDQQTRLEATHSYYARSETRELFGQLAVKFLLTLLIILGLIGYGCLRVDFRFPG